MMFFHELPHNRSLVYCFTLFMLSVSVEVDALAVTPTSRTSDSTWKLVDRKCRLSLSVGRVKGTAMPPEWAASGARLVLPDLDVQFKQAKSKDTERLLGQQTQQLLLEPLNKPTFVSIDGQKQVPVEMGAFSVSEADEQRKSSFRFFLGFPEGAERNDVKLPAERVFFTSTCWEDDAELARVMQERQADKEDLKELKDAMSNLEDDSGGYLQKALCFRSKIQMVDRINLLQERAQRQDACLPDLDAGDNTIRGPPGMIFAKEGYMSVKRRAGILGMQEQYHFVGTFTINEFLQETEEEAG